jgi:hypothetical protein
LKPVESARQAAKPAIERRFHGRFRAARHHHVGVAERDEPRRIADGVRAVEQAVTTAWFGPFIPCAIET